MRRRRFLTGSAIAVAGLAGCSSGSDNETATSPTSSGGTATGTPSGEGDLATPANTVETFYETLYGEDDIEAANELYHPQSEAPPLAPANFEAYGGVDAIQADVQSTEIVNEGAETTRVHATVEYATPAGSSTNTDYFLVRPSDEEWLVDIFLPESSRSNMSEGNVTEIMSQE